MFANIQKSYLRIRIDSDWFMKHERDLMFTPSLLNKSAELPKINHFFLNISKILFTAIHVSSFALSKVHRNVCDTCVGNM